MADQAADQQQATPAECRPCSGRGRVISNLGGTPNEITCPWCEGTGKFIPEHDAQAHWVNETQPQAAAGQEDPS